MRENQRHKCPVDGCKEQMPHHILMCRSHWRQVPGLIQVRVVQAWRKGGGQEYLDARAAAILAVNGKAGQK